MNPFVFAAALVFLLSPPGWAQSKSSTQSTTSSSDKSEPAATSSATPMPETSPTPETTSNSTSSAKPNTGKPVIALPPEKARPVKLPLFAKPPVIDGKLDDEVWKNAVVLKDFYQVQPGDNIAPSKPTERIVGYDARFMYYYFHCYEFKDKVRANIPKQTDIFNEDYV